MDKVMPKIEMPPPPEPDPQVLPDSGDASDKELIKELLDETPEENISSDIVEVEERDIPSEDDVFDDPPPSVKPLKEPEFSELPDEKPKGKRKYTRKAPMSEKQKAHLERIRKIAQEKKKAEKERKEKEKEETQIRKAEEKIKKQKEKELQKEKEESEKINNTPPPAQPQGQYFTKEDLDNAVLGAVATYDKYRKQQKKEKKERLAKEEADRKMKETIQRAIQPQSAPSDPWRSLFT
jgi:hypothetical protein